MTILQMRRAAEHRLKVLPPGRLRVAAEFLAYLEIGASDQATTELLNVPGLLKDVRNASKGIADGRGISWRKVRHDV